MEPHEHIEPIDAKKRGEGKRTATTLVLNVAIVALLLIIGYFSYTILARNGLASGDATAKAANSRMIQLDVLNGCRITGAAAKVTRSLRTSGFDVVEMKNYKMSNVRQTVVIDRVGDLASARRVAQALGVPEKNVVQQLNPDYFVDVSVIIGEDFPSLKLSHE